MAAEKKLNNFELAIKSYLDKRAEKDPLFAKTYQKKNKNIQNCCLFIINEAQKKAFSMKDGKMSALPDDEVYGLAVHYYDEDNLEIDKEGSAENAKAKVIANAVSNISTPTSMEGGFGSELNLFG